MIKFRGRLTVLFSLLALAYDASSETMIYKCKNPQGATIYKKAPCEADSDTVSTWTPKETKKPESAEGASDQDKDSGEKKGAVLKLKQNASGHYLTEGNVDGRPVIFVVDTGASHLSLPEKEAHEAQIYCDKNINMATANGNTSGCTAKVKKVQFGPFIIENTDVIIAPNLTQPLLGMNVLSLFNISQDKGEMQISFKDDKKEEEKPKQP